MNNNPDPRVYSSKPKMDITMKFSAAIIIGLVIMFALASIVILNQQSNALDNMLSASKDIESKSMEKQSVAAKARVRKNAEQVVKLLKQTIPNPMAEFDITTLKRYANVIHEDSHISYVSFLNSKGKIFASQGDKTEVKPDNIITAKVEAEGVYPGNVELGYNFNEFEQHLVNIRKENSKNMHEKNQRGRL